MYKIYKVQAGDTLESIAEKFKTSVKYLKEINGFSDNQELVIDSFIIVPVEKDSPFTTYIIKQGDTLSKLSRDYNISVEDLAALNGLDPNEYIYVNQEIAVPKKGVLVYITKEGDSIKSASEKLGTTEGSLLLQNATIYLKPNQLLTYKKEETIA